MSVRSALLAGSLLAQASAEAPPNILVLFFDDFGWGDASFNDPSVEETPHLEELARTSRVFSDFHSGASVCTPARAALLTGRYGLRTGITTNFNAESIGGLPAGERTMAQLLAETHEAHMLGKWHLGHHSPFQPSTRGFQSYLGLPFSGDMGCLDITPPSCKPGANRSKNTPVCPALCPADGDENPSNTPGIPLYWSKGANCSGKAAQGRCDEDIVQQPVDETTLNTRYTDRIVEFLEARGPLRGTAKPFLLYMGFAHTHTPMAYDPAFANASRRPGYKAAFGNTLAELDHAVGRIVGALESNGLRDDTLLVIASDNGPADLGVVDCDFIGSPGPFVGAWQRQNGGSKTGTQKTTTWEGGHRGPGLFSWPGKISPGRTAALGSTLDFVPTFLSLSGVPVPSDREVDGVDLSPMLFSDASDWSEPRFLFHPDGSGQLTAGRRGKYKFFTKTAGTKPCFDNSVEARTDSEISTGLEEVLWDDAPLVFDLEADPSESTPVDVPADVVEAYLKALEEKQASIDNTLKHTADYSKNGHAAWPCCNRESSSCRCATSAEAVV